MSSVSWKKIKTPSQAKALIRHNATECRAETNHSNPDIDASSTSQNLSLDGMTYDQRCKRYDTRVAECKANMTRVRSDAVTMIALNIKLPEGLTYASYEEQKRWCQCCYAVVSDFIGVKNIVSATADFDEIHAYLDAKTGEERLSRPEVDIRFVPAVDEKMCAKKWETVSNMQMLNQKLDIMTQNEFGMDFLTGKVPGKRSTESLKAQSQRKEIEKMMLDKAKKLEAYERELQDQRQKLSNEIRYFLACRSVALSTIEDMDTSRERYMQQLKFSDGSTAEERYKQYIKRQRADMAVTEQKLFSIADAYVQQKAGNGSDENEAVNRRYRSGEKV